MSETVLVLKGLVLWVLVWSNDNACRCYSCCCYEYFFQSLPSSWDLCLL